MAVCVLSVTLVWLLYDTAFEGQQERLVETAQSQARLIEAIAHFNAKHNPCDMPGGTFVATLSQIIDAHEHYKGFGETGEFTLARREGEQIVFLLRHRHFDLENPQPVSFKSHLAEPMRQALLGRAGTMIGLDYRGEWVLAAYEPVPLLKLGIVAKIDMAEIRAPFIRMGWIAMAISLLIIVAAIWAFLRIVDPIIIRMIKTKTYLRTILEYSNQLTERLSSIVDSLPVIPYTCKAEGDFVATYVGKNIKEVTGYE
ncbi:PAS/PAC sensor hybrid histidine kinase, partial [Candidatus Thiomargarita nelsonii]